MYTTDVQLTERRNHRAASDKNGEPAAVQDAKNSAPEGVPEMSVADRVGAVGRRRRGCFTFAALAVERDEHVVDHPHGPEQSLEEDEHIRPERISLLPEITHTPRMPKP